jgi:AtzE family amidohydrolase
MEAGTFSVVARIERALAQIERTHERFNAFTLVTAKRALSEAAALDAARASGRDPGRLAGMTYAVKNLFDLAGEVTVAGSRIHRDHPPAAVDAQAVARLREAGAICLGAVNMGEYAYDFVTENAHDGPTRNPLDPTRSAGGSSGGSAAAVAAGLVDFSLGTDTNGSIRVPSSFCGLWGLKPTYGRLGRGGTVPFVESLDHIGPIARTVVDLARTYDAMQGPDARDAAWADRPYEPALPHLDEGVASLRIAVLGGYFSKGGEPQAHAAVATVARALNASRCVELPAVAAARAAAYVITASEGGQFHLGRLRSRAADFDPATRDRFRAGALMPAAWYLHAQRFRSWWREQVRAIFEDVDILIAPATPVPATRLGQEEMILEGTSLPVRPNLGLFTQPLSFVGLPVVTAPVQSAAPLPIGVQLIAAPWSERHALRVARHLERNGVCITRPVPL